jgi:hypothetical protein
MRQDRVIRCQQCHQNFVWTQEEQEFYQAKGLNPPIYCLVCRSSLKSAKVDKFRGKISS